MWRRVHPHLLDTACCRLCKVAPLEQPSHHPPFPHLPLPPVHLPAVQRRAYHFLPGCKPELARLHLLHYQLPPGLLDSERGKPGPKKRE